MTQTTIDDDQLRVAKLVIVGWIKDWNCVALYNAISGKQRVEMEDVEKLCEKYKFLPSDWYWYFGKNGISNKYVRMFISEMDKKLSNALWDTDDNMEKLKFAPYLAKLDATGVKASSKYSKEDKAEKEKARRLAVANKLEGEYRKDYAQRMNGTHWTTVK